MVKIGCPETRRREKKIALHYYSCLSYLIGILTYHTFVFGRAGGYGGHGARGAGVRLGLYTKLISGYFLRYLEVSEIFNKL